MIQYTDNQFIEKKYTGEEEPTTINSAQGINIDSPVGFLNGATNVQDALDILDDLPDASATVKGIIQIATQMEVDAGTDDVKAVVPARIPIASTSKKGIIEIATQIEVNAGIDAERVITPSTLANYSIDPSSLFSTTELYMYSDQPGIYLECGSSLTLKAGGATVYKSGVAQSISATTLSSGQGWDFIQGIIQGGYIYAYGTDQSGYRGWKKCDLTLNISSVSNWETLTGGSIVDSNNAGFVGYGDNYFWVTGNGGNSLSRYSISGTAMSFDGSITITGANMTNKNTRVNNKGIYAGFASAAPYCRKAGYDGSLNANAQWIANSGIQLFSTDKSVYAKDANDTFVKIE